VTRELIVTDEPAQEAARRIATRLSARIETERHTTVAFSGGATPDPMLDELRGLGLPWERIAVLQVDERMAPEGSPNRNLTRLRRHLLDHVDAPAHPLPVDVGTPEEAAEQAALRLKALAGDPPVLDVVHLGIGSDGHTASLVPGDPVCEVDDREVAATRDPYQGYRRVTLTAPALSRAGLVVWLVVGEEKRDALERLLDDDEGIPATLVTADEQLVVTDLEV
jgi:6-phosphogluconolactonase